MSSGPAPQLAQLTDYVRRFERLDVLVVGDVMLDEYLQGEVDRVSPEAPVPIVGVSTETRALGGAGNVVRNLAALGARPRLCSVVGDDAEGRCIVDLLKELGVDTSGIVVDEGRPTTRKTRIVARDQQMMRVDREATHALANNVRSALEAAVRGSLRGADGVALVDYAKGVLSPEGARRMVALARAHPEADAPPRGHVDGSASPLPEAAGTPVAVDPKQHLDGYAGAALVKPNVHEAAALLGLTASTGPDVGALALGIRERLPGADVALTLGAGGMVVVASAAGSRPRSVPTAALDVYDVQGAGDTSFAALFLARLAGASLVEAALLANAASGVAVGKVGTATASADEISAWLPRVLEALRAQDVSLRS